jgi:hypothetical protein
MTPYNSATLDFNSTSPSSRRSFLGVLTAATALAVANPHKVLASMSSEEAQKQYTQRFVNLACSPSVARSINEHISAAPTYWVRPGNNFHERFASAIRINVRIYPSSAITNRFFEMDGGLPFFDTENPCRRCKDMNVVELWHFTRPDVVDQFGVLSPCNARLMASDQDYDLFRETAQSYDLDPNEWNYQYKRPVTNGRRSTAAHVVTSRTQRSPSGQPSNTVLITPYDLFE